MPHNKKSAPLIARAGRLTVYELFHSRVERDPHALAIEAAAHHLTYADLDHRVRHLAAGLSARGIARGDRIALLAENRTEYIEIELAAASLGAIVACQNWRLTAEELRHCISLVTPKRLIVSARFAPLSATLALPSPPPLIIEHDYATLLSAPPIEPPTNIDPEDGLLILYTSGTTGLPKGALISHRAEIARMTALRLDLHVTESEAFLAWSPLFHMAAADQTLAALMSGATVIIHDGFDANEIVRAMTTHKLGWLVLMPFAAQPSSAATGAKYMIKSGGENIYPAEIERVLLADLRVADAVVVRRKRAGKISAQHHRQDTAP